MSFNILKPFSLIGKILVILLFLQIIFVAYKYCTETYLRNRLATIYYSYQPLHSANRAKIPYESATIQIEGENSGSREIAMISQSEIDQLQIRYQPDHIYNSIGSIYEVFPSKNKGDTIDLYWYCHKTMDGNTKERMVQSQINKFCEGTNILSTTIRPEIVKVLQDIRNTIEDELRERNNIGDIFPFNEFMHNQGYDDALKHLTLLLIFLFCTEGIAFFIRNRLKY